MQTRVFKYKVLLCACVPLSLSNIIVRCHRQYRCLTRDRKACCWLTKLGHGFLGQEHFVYSRLPHLLNSIVWASLLPLIKMLCSKVLRLFVFRVVHQILMDGFTSQNIQRYCLSWPIGLEVSSVQSRCLSTSSLFATILEEANAIFCLDQTKVFRNTMPLVLPMPLSKMFSHCLSHSPSAS